MADAISNVLKLAVETRLLHSYQALLVAMHSKHGVGYHPSELSKMTGLSMASVGYAKKELLGAGMVEERQPYRDQRGTKIYLTAAGKKEAGLLWQAIKGLAEQANSHYIRKP